MISGDFSPLYPERGTWRTRVAALIIGLLFAAGLTLVFTYQRIDEAGRLEVGQVSAHAILAPERVTFASGIQTAEAQSKAQAAVKDVYDPATPDRARAQVTKATAVLDFVDTVRHDPYSDGDQKIKMLLAIPDLGIGTLTLTRTLALDENAFHRVVSETLYVVDTTMRDEIRASDITAAIAKLPSRVSLALSADQADLAVQWARPFVVPNSFYSATKTEDLRAAERERVGTVYRTVEKGEAIVREGEVITPMAFEALDELRLVAPRRETGDYLGDLFAACGLVALLGLYLGRLRPALIAQPRALALVAFLLLVGAVAAKAFATDQRAQSYLIPFSAGAMLLAVLIDSQTAFGAVFALALIVGYQAQQSFELAAYVLAGGWIAALSLGRIERLSAFWWSGLFVAAANLITVTIFRTLAHETNLTSYAIAALGNAALAGLIALGGVSLLGRVFGITTSLDLLELTRPTHPLLKKLLAEAPGTYHHSLIVSQLAEQAAQRIGADALLVRVAAYYHDVGKTREPQSFVENQFDGVNLHDSLDPQTSAGIVIDHVQRGIALAEKYGLPRRVRELIPQHHGTTLAAYFHHRAIENTDARVDEDDFRYGGPRPQTREAGILMLADGVEATARAERPSTPEQIRVIINRIVDERLSDGQLDESNLTLRDIQQIKDAFLGVLQGMFHARVKYPVSGEQSTVINFQRKTRGKK